MTKIPSYLLSLAGEYRICSELNKRGVFATVTYGHHKGVDVYAIGERKQIALRIEVKTGQGSRFVTGITQKRLERGASAPDFWVLFQLRPNQGGTFTERFFVLTHREICRVQRKRNTEYAKRYQAKHGRQPDFSKGVDNVTVPDVEEYEDQWSQIEESLQGRS